MATATWVARHTPVPSGVICEAEVTCSFNLEIVKTKAQTNHTSSCWVGSGQQALLLQCLAGSSFGKLFLLLG